MRKHQVDRTLELLRSYEVSMKSGEKRPFLGHWSIIGRPNLDRDGRLRVDLRALRTARLEIVFSATTLEEAAGDPDWIAGVVQETAATTDPVGTVRVEI